MRKILLAIILFAVAPELSFSATVEYKNFYDLSAFTLGVRAAELNAIPDSNLQLISGTWQRDGYAILSSPIKLSENFSTHFSFRITNNVEGGDADGLGADWLVFNMQTDLNPPGGKAVSIEYDIFNNGARDDNSGNHVGINIDHNFDSIAIQHVASRFNDGDIWHTWIEYNNTLLEIFISIDDKKPINPILSYPIDILTHIGTPFVYLGFHAASGAYGADFSILDWEFISPAEVPSTIEVDIDIKPGSDPNSINLKSNGLVPVAILSTIDFKATAVDPGTVLLAMLLQSNGRWRT